ncbi:NHL repeat-containing protein [Hymenobacter yonginensis]|uniref:Uncharacterized protein n=1 Tax=Hymenobacter yonginensis TaxID=748197 RepID=A0ABY7PRF2_9BACT|nr:hypothetical protein [Hymenobacter yonginensis]WBO85417.1 hypothetical protein O9Z63_04045 [Hymenobacter yonginensis]
MTAMQGSRRVTRRLAVLAGLVAGSYLPAQAQAPLDAAWRWVAHSTESGAAVVQKATTDAMGNSYITGRFSRQVRFGEFRLQSAGSSDIFVAKVSPAGQWLWATAAGGPESDMAAGIVLDAQGNIVVAGSFSATAAFGTLARRSQGSHDVFVGTLTPDGRWSTVSSAGGPDQDQATALAIDAQNQVLVGGRFRNSASFGDFTLRGSSDSDGFVAKLDTHGQWAWASQSAGTEQAAVSSLTVDAAGNTYAVGYFAGTAAFGASRLSAAGTHDAFVAKLAPNGTWLWGIAGGGSSTDYAKGVAVAADGSVFVTGSFSGHARFGSTDLTSLGGDDAYVARLSNQGEWQWVYTIKGNALEDATDVCLGPGGSIYVTGRFSRGAQYGTTALASKGSTDVFVARLSKNGRWLDFLSAGSTSSDEASTVKPSPTGDVFVGGTVGTAGNFGNVSVGEANPSVFIGRLQFPARSTVEMY